ncbi:chitin elicitor receptor kinase 1-like isoform X2 [Carex rostrata]
MRVEFRIPDPYTNKVKYHQYSIVDQSNLRRDCVPPSLSLSLRLNYSLLQSRVYHFHPQLDQREGGKAMIESKFVLVLVILASGFFSGLESKCPKTCDLALGSYYVSTKASVGIDLNLTYIASLFEMTAEQVLPYNPTITSKDYIKTGDRVHVNFSCDCIDNSFLGHTFQYTVQGGDTYNSIAKDIYANLTNTYSLTKFNSYPANNVQINATVNVTVNCSCGNSSVSDQYGLFETYPLQSDENASSVASTYKNISAELVAEYNPGVNFSSVGAILYVPTHDPNGSYRALSSKRNLSGGAIAGIVIGAIIILLSIGLVSYCLVDKRKKVKKASLLPLMSGESSVPLADNAPSRVAGVTVDKSVEFSYEELSKATNDFSMANKIGQGGYGAVYYAELRGEKAAIKKMETQSAQEFLAELKVLTHVHHLNLVRLIGYCIEGALFLIYEYIENGNLSQRLRSSGWPPLPWANRVQIALDSARGLEYIHEHTVPVYIHRDIKSANILIDKNDRAKVADFGLAKLTEVGNMSLPTRVVGTFGYMPPEYARYGDVSPKVDVYAFGVVLYELISAKEAIIKPSADSSSESKGLVGLFDDALSKEDPKESLKKIIDPKLGDDYPIDSIMKVAQLAKACTQDEPNKRPSMRSVVVALMTLSSASELWDINHLFDNNPGLTNLMSGR